MTRGIYTVADLRARSIVDPVTGCWHWQGSICNGIPHIWTFCHERGEKRTMSGPKAVWNLAHQAAPRPGWFCFRRCPSADCVHPVHVDQARDKAAIGRHIRRSGRRKGMALESRRANAAKALAACGITPTPAATVLAIRAAEPGVTNVALGLLLGVNASTISRIRSGERRRDITTAEAA